MPFSKYSPKQKKLAKVAKPRNKITAADFISWFCYFDKYSKSSGISRGTLSKVYQRGLGAYYSSGSRPKVSAHQWACGRVRS